MKYVVYELIVNDGVNKYVGSSSQINKRLSRHFYDLGKNQHHSKLLQSLFNENKEISVNILLETSSEEEAKSKEQSCIDSGKYTCNVGMGVNGGDNFTNNPNRDEIRSKISATLKRKYRNKEIAPVIRYGSDNPNWRGGSSTATCVDCGVSISPYKTRCTVCSKLGKNNPFHGKVHSEETKRKISRANEGNIPPNSVSVVANGIEYRSYSKAGESQNCTAATVINRCKSDKFPNWFVKV